MRDSMWGRGSALPTRRPSTSMTIGGTRGGRSQRCRPRRERTRLPSPLAITGMSVWGIRASAAGCAPTNTSTTCGAMILGPTVGPEWPTFPRGEELFPPSSSLARTRLADYPGACISRGTAFAVGNKGYVGLGWSDGSCDDVWEYDPETDSWTGKADFPGGPRYHAVSFTRGDEAFVACGVYQQFFEPLEYLTDLWRD